MGLPVVRDDRSLTPAEYAGFGLPAIDAPWSAGDYATAVIVLADLRERDALLLPRFGSDASGGVFERLFDPANLPSAEGGADAWAALGELMAGPLPELVALYSPTQDGRVFANEWTTAVAFLIQATARGYDALAAGLELDDATAAAFDAGAAQTLTAALQVARYIGDDIPGTRLRMLQRVAPAYGVIVPQLAPSARGRLAAAVAVLLDAETNDDARSLLRAMQATHSEVPDSSE